VRRAFITIGGLAVFAVALMGLYLYLKNRPVLVPEFADTSRPEISRLDLEQITSMEFQRESGLLRLTKADEGWQISGAAIPIDDSKIYDLQAIFGRLYAEDVIAEETPADLELYGLEEPRAVGVATMADGSLVEVLLGDQTPAGTTSYLMLRGDPKLYSVWMNVGMHMNYSVADLRSTVLPRIDTQTVTHYHLKNANGEVEVVYYPQGQSPHLFLMSRVVLTKPYVRPQGADMEKLQPFVDTLGGVQIDAFVEDAPADLSRYGLEPPQVDVEAITPEGSVHYLFGTTYDDGKMTYFKLAGQSPVYGIRESRIGMLRTAKPFNLADHFVLILGIDFVDQIRIDGQGRSHVLGITRTQVAGQEEPAETFSVDGKSVPDRSFRTLYQAIIGLLADAPAPQRSTGAAEVTITYVTNNDDLGSLTVGLVPYNRDFYATDVEGARDFLVSRPQVSAIFQALDTALEAADADASEGGGQSG